jgi:hypothetical protein
MPTFAVFVRSLEQASLARIKVNADNGKDCAVEWLIYPGNREGRRECYIGKKYYVTISDQDPNEMEEPSQELQGL